MPFFQPFKRTFDDGDILYGLTNARIAFANKTGLFTKRFQLPFLIDGYAITQFEDLVQRHPGIHSYKPVPLDQHLFRKATRMHHKYRTLFDDCGYVTDGYRTSTDRAMARKCKAGLCWITDSECERHIHFLLDDLKMKNVINKNHEKDQTGIFITGSELRWIYRNRYKPNVKNRIQFWHKGVPVLPPWITESALWEKYSAISGRDISATLAMFFDET